MHPWRLVLVLTAAAMSLTAAASEQPVAVGGRPAKRGPMPDWASNARWYYVVVARFHNGDPTNDPPGTLSWTTRWPPPGGWDTSAARMPHLGGDLKGVSNRLPYLRQLGVNVLCLSPVFAAPSELKDDTSDFRHVDDTFGVKGAGAHATGETQDPKTWKITASDRVLLQLIRDAHRAGIRVVLEIDFTTVGHTFWAWKDVLQNGPQSPYQRWFDVTDWGPPIAWNGPDGANGRRVFLGRPVGAFKPLLENHLFFITRRWMDPNADGDPSDGVDGWLLRHADAVSHGFWKRWRSNVKAWNPNALIVGVMRGDPRPFLTGDELDTVTNTALRKILARFFAGGDASYTLDNFMADLETVAIRYSADITTAAPTPLSGPGTHRFLTALARPERSRTTAKPRPPARAERDKQDTAAERNKKNARAQHDETTTTAQHDETTTTAQRDETTTTAQRDETTTGAERNAPNTHSATPHDVATLRDRWRLATALAHFFPGAPMTCYGDEVGMSDAPIGAAASALLGPKPMWWRGMRTPQTRPKSYRTDFAALVKRLHSLRDAQPAVRHGGYRTVLVDEQRRMFAFARTLPDAEVIVLANYGDTRQDKVTVPAGRPGQLVGILTPQLKPAGPAPRRPPRAGEAAPPLPQLRVGGSRQFVGDDGNVTLNIRPMSIRVVVAMNDQP